MAYVAMACEGYGLQVSYKGLHLERGVQQAGYNLVVRHEAAEGSNVGCRWTHAAAPAITT